MNQFNEISPGVLVEDPPINSNLLNLKSDVMGFLNEAMIMYPEAISLASGRPSAEYFDLKESLRKVDSFVRYKKSVDFATEEAILSDLGQYNKASGIINEIVAKYLVKDEKIIAKAEDIIITVGAQEAMGLVLNTLCHPDRHTIAIENPSYIGMSAYAGIAGYDIVPVATISTGIDVGDLENKIVLAKRSNKPIRLLYVLPDYQNPTGAVMSVKTRVKLLKMAEKHDFYILEDNAYGCFTYEGDKLPSLKSIDVNSRVVFIGSFSKLLFPSLRLAVLVANQKFSYQEKEISLSEQIAILKGYVTLNTPSINQAILGGYLVDNGFSLKNIVQSKVEGCFERRRAICDALTNYLGKYQNLIKWNVPKGGYFLTLTLPFEINEKSVMECASNYGVIFCPMSFFYINGVGGKNQIRLAFSNLKPEEINIAISRLANYIESKLN